MKINNEFQKYLDKSILQLQEGSGKRQMEWKFDKGLVQLDIVESDQLALQLKNLKIMFKDIPLHEPDCFERHLGLFEQKINYLSEVLSVVEKDMTNLQAIMCSAMPMNKGTALEYFKVRVYGCNECRFCRIFHENHKDQVIPFVISYDLLRRLVTDVADIFTSHE